jgi:hypothetical protein
MDNAGVVASNLNELTVLENLRSQQDPNALNSRQNTAASHEQETDLVELSRESLQLSQVEENPPGQDINPIQEVETGNTQPLPPQPQPIIGENENLIERLDNIIGAFATTIETETTEVTGTTSPRTTIGTVENETEPEAGVENLAEENPTETPIPVEIQANQVSQINGILANANGFPANSPVTDVDRALEPTQYWQQLLLQNVGTQLAQVAPPSNVISLLA